MIESPTRIVALAVSRCTDHSLKLIAPAFVKSIEGQIEGLHPHQRHTLTCQENTVTELRNFRVSIFPQHRRVTQVLTTMRG